MGQNIPQGIDTNNTRRAFTFGYLQKKIATMPVYTNHQLLLMKLRDDFCNKKASVLARKIEKDPTYVSRLFYPKGKKGGKGIGLEIMQACSKAFGLAPGFWEGVAELPASYQVEPDDHPTMMRPAKAVDVIALPKRKIDKWTFEAMEIFSRLTEAQRAACVVTLRAYEAAVGPPRYGQTL
jgi:hypothetical protein